jgi:hypothetical protein
LLDDIWSYLDCTELLNSVELVCKSWSQLSHRYGIGWHTLDLNMIQVPNCWSPLPWHVLCCLLNTRLFRHELGVRRMSRSLRYLKGDVESPEQALALFNTISEPLSSKLTLQCCSRLQHMDLIIRLREDADLDEVQNSITLIGQHQRLLTLSLNFQHDNCAHRLDDDDDDKILIKFGVESMPKLEQLIVKGEYYQLPHEDEKDHNSSPTGGMIPMVQLKGPMSSIHNKEKDDVSESSGGSNETSNLKSTSNKYEYAYPNLTHATFETKNVGRHFAYTNAKSFDRWLLLVGTSLRQLHLNGNSEIILTPYIEAIVDARLTSLTSLTIDCWLIASLMSRPHLVTALSSSLLMINDTPRDAWITSMLPPLNKLILQPSSLHLPLHPVLPSIDPMIRGFPQRS